MSVISVARLPRVCDTSIVSSIHTVAVTVLCLGTATFSLSGVLMTPAVVAVALAFAVVVVGLPHGGLDHRTGDALLRPRAGRLWALPFLTGYLAIGLVVLIGWSVAPLLTIASFFTLSAIHFGDTELGPRWRATLFGGLPIWVPLLAQPSETATLLAWVTPGAVDVAGTLSDLRPALIGLALASTCVWVVGLLTAARRGDRDGRLDALRLAATALLLATAPVLIGFAISFCGWHSLRELGRLAARAEPRDPVAGFGRVALAAAPLALLAAAMATGAAWYFGAGREVTPVVVQAVFLGLSAVAVPHILLHAVADWAGVDPFAPRDQEVTCAV